MVAIAWVTLDCSLIGASAGFLAHRGCDMIDITGVHRHAWWVICLSEPVLR